MKTQLLAKWNKELQEMNDHIHSYLVDYFDDCDRLAMRYWSTLSETTAIEDMVDELVGDLLSEVDSAYADNLLNEYEFDADTVLVTYRDHFCQSEPEEVFFRKGYVVLLEPATDSNNKFNPECSLLVIKHPDNDTPSLLLADELQREYHIKADQVEELIQ